MLLSPKPKSQKETKNHLGSCPKMGILYETMIDGGGDSSSAMLSISIMSWGRPQCMLMILILPIACLGKILILVCQDCSFWLLWHVFVLLWDR